MALCSLVIDKVKIRRHGVTKMMVGRIIIGIEDQMTKSVTFESKYIHYPSSEFVNDDFCLNYNAIDWRTLATQGEKPSTVIDWVRSAVSGRKIIVCGKSDLKEILDLKTCHIIDLQDFFCTDAGRGILEPVSLSRLCKRFFDVDSHAIGKRDPFEEGRFKIALFYVMKGFKAGKISPPFTESMFPKEKKAFKIIASAPASSPDIGIVTSEIVQHGTSANLSNDDRKKDREEFDECGSRSHDKEMAWGREMFEKARKTFAHTKSLDTNAEGKIVIMCTRNNQLPH